MKYSDVRLDMRSGDVLMVKGTHLVGRLIRSITGESFNHVAMVLRSFSGVFVVEMREGKGFRLTPASQWFEEQHKKTVLWGKFPGKQRGGFCHEIFAMRQRSKPYSYWTLITVWISQFTNRKAPGRLVCSTFIQKDWDHCGYTMFEKLADPGDFMEHARDINVVKL